MAKIAATHLASGDGWSVDDVVCFAGPQDRPYEEQHEHVAIAIVTGGSFQYRGSTAGPGRELMTPGSLLLGNAGQCFECGHEHAQGDRCLSFRFSPEYFSAITKGVRRGRRERFGMLRLPPVRELSPLIAHAIAAARSSSPAGTIAWEELGVRLAVEAVKVDSGRTPSRAPVTAAALARVTRAVRLIDGNAGGELTLASLATEAGLSPYHFLRTFEDLTGATPHQYVMRTRLRQAAARLLAEPAKIIDVALGCGFGDVSNFNRAFRAEFGVSPRAYRSGSGRSGL
ncbi:MAG TPA: AraC family transcriptional regulator [Vicinamibacterales bacterium]|nr:AraC family transcriptional regulator [Vicinamibacterales bacterium]